MTVREVEFTTRGVLIDGLMAEQCLELYEHMQRGEFAPGYMTPAQIDYARAMWSAELRAKVAASEAERRAGAPSVMIQIDAEDL